MYDIHVERYLKGKGDEVLSVIQFDRIVSANQSQNKIGQGRAMPSSEILPTRGSRYILFLTENAHAEGLWQLPGRPYKFRIWFGRASVESSVGGVSEEFRQIPEEEFISQIETLVANG